MAALTYSVITPARNEAATLPRLAAALRRQTRLPQEWVIVENGSSDSTMAVAERIQAEVGWARLLVVPDGAPRERGAPIVRAIHAGVEALETQPDIVVNVDADDKDGRGLLRTPRPGF